LPDLDVSFGSISTDSAEAVGRLMSASAPLAPNRVGPRRVAFGRTLVLQTRVAFLG
jgi:hypothetical protein